MPIPLGANELCFIVTKKEAKKNKKYKKNGKLIFFIPEKI